MRLADKREMRKLVTPRGAKTPYVIIDAELCKGCRYCISACPKKIIGTATKINQSGYLPAQVIEERAHLCTGCISCAIMCPDAAISVYRPNRAAAR